MSTSPASQLRRLLEGDHLLVAPGIYDGLTAALVERHGFRAAYVSGGAASAAVLGVPDLGLLNGSDMRDHLLRLRGATSLPLIVDMDTGYGNELNIRHAIDNYVRLGAAAVHLEDQVFPKRCGHLLGKEVIDRASAVAKVRAAVHARGDDDLVIIARTDALAPLGLQEAIERGKSFADAGADVVFVEAPRSLADLEAIGAAINVPLLINVLANSHTPLLSAEEYAQLGYRIAIYPSLAVGAATAAITRALATFAETGYPPAEEAGPAELLRLVGLDDWLAWPDKVGAAQGPRGRADDAGTDHAAPASEAVR